MEQAVSRRLFFLATLALGAASLIAFIYLPFPVREWIASDFKVFWTAGQLEQSRVYDFAAVTAALPGETGLRPYLSPPSLLLAMSPLAAMGLWPAFLIWSAIGLSLFCAVSWRIAGRASLPLLIAAPAFHWAVMAGQVTLLVGGLIFLGILCLKRRPLAAGLLFACAALLKPQVALLVPVALMAGGHYRALLAAIGGGGVAGLLCLALQGPSLWLSWLGAVGRFAELIQANGFIGKGITPAALAYSYRVEGLAENLALAAGALLGLACCWQAFRRSEDPALRGGALICGGLLCTPYALVYEAAPLLPAAAALLCRRETRLATRIMAAIAVFFPFSPLTVIFFTSGLFAALARTREQPLAPELKPA